MYIVILIRMHENCDGFGLLKRKFMAHRFVIIKTFRTLRMETFIAQSEQWLKQWEKIENWEIKRQTKTKKYYNKSKEQKRTKITTTFLVHHVCNDKWYNAYSQYQTISPPTICSPSKRWVFQVLHLFLIGSLGGGCLHFF